jgi:CBS domain-containing protein
MAMTAESTATTDWLPDLLEVTLGTVADAMAVPTVTIDARDTAAQALRRLEREGVTGGPVMQGNRVVGVVTIGDLLAGLPRTVKTTGPFLRADLALATQRPEPLVRERMKRALVVARPADPLTKAIAVMAEGEVNRLPVVEETGALVGILARTDVIRAIARVIRGVRELEILPRIRPD